MNKKDRKMIERIERELKIKLNDKEKMYCLLAFELGIVNGFEQAIKIAKKG